ncbi:FtsX-like permease family protein [Sphingobacterium olei]|uniref:FtsX-like permease family protein n=1 Tax=Sphingobacterium olei TaxID=2571155 RepID=A0A4U0P1Y0_9SPHI|nr:ABC transporter permease [Sphingobacterium olei]TJZ61291.1 FtsX-like permease family protein [Sphingobacterium olei]
MIKNYLKIAIRNLWKYKAFSLLNILGLSVGIASSVLILLWVFNERSYDNFHQNASKIYRITSGLSEDFKAAVVPPPLAPKIAERSPSIKRYTRISHQINQTFENKGIRFEEKGGYYVDTTFLNMFSFSLIAGNRHTAFQDANSILITESMAKKYFGKTNVVGQTLKQDNRKLVTISAVLADLPNNTHFQFDYLLPMTAISPDNWMYETKEDWRNFVNYGYIELDENYISSSSNRQKLEQEIAGIYREHVSGSLLKTTFHLQALPDIHLYSGNFQVDFAGRGNHLYVNTLFLVAIFILVVACINFMNLTTARSARRAKEVGLRKVVGAKRLQLVFQFFGESMLITYISLILGMTLVWLISPVFSLLIGKTLETHIFDSNIIITLLSISLFTGILSGCYPALYLSGFKPINVLKGVLTTSNHGHLIFRNALVVIQFVVSIFLLVGTIVIYKQLNFIKNRNIGFDKSNLIYVEMNGEIWGKQAAYKDALAQNSLTSNFTVIDMIPSNLKSGTVDFQYEGKDPNSDLIVPMMDVSESFIDVFDIKMVAGRPFSKEYQDSSNYIINERLADIMGISPHDAIGMPFTLWGVKGEIIGVVKDFNFKPASQIIEPLMLRFNDWGGMFVVKAQPHQLQATIRLLEEINTSFNPNFPFSYGFVDQELDKLYESEHRLGNLFNIFAGLGIFISCLGLYGLSSFLAEQRFKEIGIRKVLGSSVAGIVYLLTKSFLGLLILAIVIAIPVSWYGASTWLSGFAYRIEINWIIFGTAAFLTFVVALLTVSYESIKAARANPVDSLRDE